MTISPLGIPCACGNDGCWEQYASEQALLRYLRQQQQSTDKLEPSPDFVTTAVATAQDNESYRKAFQSVGDFLGIGISNIVNVFNPELVVIGGTIAQGRVYYMDELLGVLQHRAISFNAAISVEFAEPDAIAVGAACLIVSQAIFDGGLADV